jgi:hypothetical protein
MKKEIFKEKYPIYSLKLNKNEIAQKTVPQIIEYFKQKIQGHPIAKFIAIFDHHKYTTDLQGEIIPEIIDVQNIIFCFGSSILNTKVLAVRPRSIGVIELEDSFIIEFMEAPGEKSSQTMEEWTKALAI